MASPRKGLTTRQQAIELKYGKPWREVVGDLLILHRHWGKVAVELDIDYATLWRWWNEDSSEAEREAVAV